MPCSVFQSHQLANARVFRHQKAIISRKAGASAAERSPLKSPTRPAKTNERDTGDANRKIGSLAGSHGHGYSQDSEKRLNGLGSLSLEQSEYHEQKDAITFVNNPRQRGPQSHSESPIPPAESHNGKTILIRGQHGKSLSGGRDVDVFRSDAPIDEAEYKRGHPGPKQPLYNPNIDSPNNAQSIRKGAKFGYVYPIQEHHPTKDSRPLQNFPLAPKGLGHPGKQGPSEKPYVHQVVNQVHRQKQQPSSSIKEQGDDSSESPVDDDFPGDNPHESHDVQPEMLLQPETRPISHDQLVVEVKGIYAGLVMVEAKCIDIDERQAAAAQEKDPAKRSELKDDQWQSLIALHKQASRMLFYISYTPDSSRY